MTTTSIGILGGTFDPVHFGHLRAALEIKQILQLDKMHFIPCRSPVHKDSDTVASAQQRLAMLNIAVTGVNGFVVDDREILKDRPSYMLDTLKNMRQDFADAPLCLLLGSDAFLQLPTWHNWRELLDYAHIIVMTRPGYPLRFDDELKDYFEQNKLDDYDNLKDNTAGFIYVQEISAIDISATNIRALLRANVTPRYLLPDDVLAYITQHAIY